MTWTEIKAWIKTHRAFILTATIGAAILLFYCQIVYGSWTHIFQVIYAS